MPRATTSTTRLAARTTPPSPDTDAGVRLRLMGGFSLLDGGVPISLPLDAQRVIALLALQGPTLPRSVIAGRLWLESSEDHASGSLRSALWRIGRRTRGIAHADAANVTLDQSVTTDVEAASTLANRVVGRGNPHDPMDGVDPDSLTGELLPGWYDDWVTVERERLRQRSVHTLEALARQLAAHGEFARAIDVALVALGVDPYRETAHRALIEIHLTEGNVTEAVRHYHRYRILLADELGMHPSVELQRLVTRASGSLSLPRALAPVMG